MRTCWIVLIALTLGLSACAHQPIDIASPPPAPAWPGVTFQRGTDGYCLDEADARRLVEWRLDYDAYRDKMDVWFTGVEEGLK